MYDSRLGRFLSVDPLTRDYPWYTPYQFAGNKPIWKIDIDGLEEGDSKFTAFATARITFSDKKFSFGLGAQYKPSENISFALNVNNYTDNNKLTANAFTSIHKSVSLGLTLNQNGSVKLFGGGSKQSEIPTALLLPQDGAFKLGLPPITGPVVSQNDVFNSNYDDNNSASTDVANTNNTNSKVTSADGGFKLNKGEDKPSEPAPFGSNYNEKPFSKEEKQKTNEQIKIGVDPKRAQEKSISNNKKAVFGK
jgi:hypothetical protein